MRRTQTIGRALRAAAVAAAGALFLFGADPTPAPAPTPCTVTVYPPSGLTNARATPGGPGLVLSGAGFLGMPYDEVFRWIGARLGQTSKRAGNVLVLQAEGEDDYTDIFYRYSRFASVREILIPHCASRSAVNAVATYADAADVVLFTGGDQANYVIWKGSKLIDAVRRVYTRGGFVGGGSAGLAIQGEVVFNAVAADRVLPDDENLGSPMATKNPYGPAVSLTTNLFAWPPLRNTITDSHFARRDRFGRLTAFMARSLRDGLLPGPHIYGLGIDEGSTLVVDRDGIATLLERTGTPYHTRGAYVLEGGPAQRIAPGKPLLYTVYVTHLTRVGGRYDLVHHSGSGVHYSVTVDGSKHGLYSRDPY